MTEDVRIRLFDWEDLEAFARLYSKLKSIADTEKAVDPAYMRELLSLPSSDPRQNCFLAEVDQRLAGFAQMVPELRIGRTVMDGGVLESFHGLGIGHALVRAACGRAEELGASVLHAQVPASNADARRLLESEDFRVIRRYWQMRWWVDGLPVRKLLRGFSMRSFVLGQDEEALTRLQNAAFEGSWGFCPNTVEEISARVRMSRTDPEGIILVMDGDHPVAYNWTHRVANEFGSTGWIAMTGVDPEYQRKGLGRQVLLAGMEYLKSAGVKAVELEVDYANAPARKLYLKLGFEQVSESLWYEKALGDHADAP